MALVDTQDVQLRIAVNTSGDEGVKALARQLSDLNAQGALGAEEFSRLEAEFSALEKQSGLVTTFRQLKSESAGLKDALDKAQAEAQRLGKELATAETPSRKLTAEFTRAKREVALAEAAWRSNQTALQGTRKEMDSAGISSKSLVDAQRKITAAVQDMSSKVQSANPAFRTLGTSAEQATAAMSRLGIRSADAIQADIADINSDLQRLASNAKVSSTDFDRAFSAAQSRIAGLQREMSGAVDPFTESTARATGGISGFLSKLSPVAGAIAAAFSVQAITKAVVEFDSLSRTLAAIKGDGAAAARELGYITEASSRLGLELGSASKSYAQFLAATKGTALEGEKSRQIFEAVSGSMSRLGKSSADTEGAMLALGQMVSKGVVSMEELRQQLGERLPGAMQAAADGAGVTVAELTKMVSSGQVLAEDLLPSLAAQLDKTYGNTGPIESYSASWNRLTGAITEAVGRLGQTAPVATVINGSLSGLKETVVVLGTGVLTVTEAFSLFGKTLGTVAAAISSGNFKGLGDEISRLTDEALTNINALASKSALASGSIDSLGKSAAAAADQAAQGTAGWLATVNAYAKAGEAAEAYVAESVKAAAARKAEGEAALLLVQTFGTEAQQRQAAADASAENARALEQVAVAREREADTLRSNVLALQESLAATGAESAAKQDVINKTREAAAAKAEEAAAARAVADAAQINAVAMAAESQSIADNAERLADLRAAYKDAAAAAALITESRQRGVASADDERNANLAAGSALALYRDALSDTERAINAKAAAERASTSLAERSIQLAIEEARTRYEVAKANGYQITAGDEINKIKRLEIQLSALKAEALASEAKAMAAKLALDREELALKGDLTPAVRAELDARQKLIEVKIKEAEIAAVVADRLKQLELATRYAAQGADDARGKYDRLSGSIDSVGDSARSSSSDVSTLADQLERASAAQVSGASGVRTENVNARQQAIIQGLVGEQIDRFVEVYGDLQLQGQQEAIRNLARGPVTADFAQRELARYSQGATAEAVRQARKVGGTRFGGSLLADKTPTAASAASAVATTNVYRVDLSIDGRTTTINTADKESAESLIDTLAALKGRFG